MRKQIGMHLVVVLLAAILLSMLFWKSQINQAQHMSITTTLLTLKEVDQALNQRVIQNQTGLHKNFDFISRSQQEVLKVLEGLRQQLNAYDSNVKGLERQLSNIATLEKEKSELVDRYKQLAAVNKFTKQNLPGAVRKLIVSVSGSNTISHTDRQSLKQQVKRIENSISRYIAGFGAADIRLPGMLERLRVQVSRSNDIDNTMRDLFTWFINTVNTVFTSTQSLSELVQQIQHIETEKEINRLQSEYEGVFAKRSRVAFTYKKLLFAASIVLLVYLAVVLFRLRAAGVRLEESNKHLEFRKHALDQHAIVSITDIRGDIIYANDKFCEISKYTREELIGKKHNIIKSDKHDKAFFRDMWRTIANGRIWQGEICNQAKDGSYYWVETTLIPRLDAEGKPYEYIGMRTDITAQKQAEREVVALARFPMENPEPVLRIDKTGTVIFHNVASYMLLDHWHTKLHRKLPYEWAKKVLGILESGKAEEVEITVLDNCFLLNLTPVVESGYVNIYGRDITEKKQAEASLSYQATHDGLTGLVNRYAFEMELEKSLTIARQQNKHHIVLYIDLDQFKIVNDTCGHVAGDELLRQLSQMMLSMFRENDTLARLGGDEFGVLLNNCDITAGKKIANELLEMINQFRFIWQEQQFEVGASIGMVEVNADCDSIISIMGRADVACYAAKDAGRHQIKVFNHNDSESAQRQSELQWASQIPKALVEDRFCLMVQSIAPLHQQKALKPHYEILLRMIDENGDFIAPGAFIPAAERYNLMQSIDQWVVSHAFQFLSDYMKFNDLKDLPVLAINLSGESMGSEDLLTFIHDQIEVNKIPAENLCFEVTETAAIVNLNKALVFINSLREMGCSFALDDFGCGLSSFAYLKSLPVDYLKIDGSFVKDMVDDPIDASMVAAINQVGHIMGIHTIAEFVEDAKIMAALTELGVDYAQGYHIDKPVPLYEKFPISQLRDSQLYG